MPYHLEKYLALSQASDMANWRKKGWSETRIAARLKKNEAADREWCEALISQREDCDQQLKRLWQQVVGAYGRAEGDFWRKEKWLYSLSQAELEELATRVKDLLASRIKPNATELRQEIFAWRIEQDTLKQLVEAKLTELQSELPMIHAARLLAEERAEAERRAKEALAVRVKELEAQLTAQEKRGVKRRPEGEDSVAGGLFRTQPKKEEINSLSSESSEEKTPRVKRIKRRR